MVELGLRNFSASGGGLPLEPLPLESILYPNIPATSTTTAISNAATLGLMLCCIVGSFPNSKSSDLTSVKPRPYVLTFDYVVVAAALHPGHVCVHAGGPVDIYAVRRARAIQADERPDLALRQEASTAINLESLGSAAARYADKGS